MNYWEYLNLVNGTKFQYRVISFIKELSVSSEALNQNEAVIRKYCKKKKLAGKGPSLVNCEGLLFLHDNARPHIAPVSLDYSTKFGSFVLSSLLSPPHSIWLTSFNSFQRYSERWVKNILSTPIFSLKSEEFYA